MGRMNVTASGISCQFWLASQPHVPKYTDVGKEGDTEAGEHNHCRNPSGELGGVWCYIVRFPDPLVMSVGEPD